MYSARDILQMHVGNAQFATSPGGCYTNGPYYIITYNCYDHQDIHDPYFECIISPVKGDLPSYTNHVLYGPYYLNNCGKSEGAIESATIVYN